MGRGFDSPSGQIFILYQFFFVVRMYILLILWIVIIVLVFLRCFSLILKLLMCLSDSHSQKSCIFRSHESFKVGCDWSRAAFGPVGRLLAVGAADGAAYVWNTHSGRLEAILKDHT